MWLRTSALSFCLLVVVAVTSALPTADLAPTEQTPIAERRTFKHKKHLPLLKKHKKFGGWLPHVFGKTEYRGIPTPIYKVHRYHGLEVKPVTDVDEVSFLASQPVVESYNFLPQQPEFVHIDHVQQPILPPAPPVFDHVSYPIHFLPTPVPAAPAFTFVQPGPVNIPVPLPQAPLPDVHILAHQALPVPSTPVPPVEVSTPAPLDIHAPVTPSAPLLPPLALPHAFSSLPLALPSPPALPPLSAVHTFVSTPAPLLASDHDHDHDFSYPPSDVSGPSFVKDHSDHPDIIEEEVKSLPQPGLLQKIKGWKIQKVTSALSHLSKSKPFKHSAPAIELPERVPEVPVVHLPTPTVVPVVQAVQTVQFPEPIHPPTFHAPQIVFPPVTPAPVNLFPVKYENFPPYPTPVPQQLFNSYGTPIPHDSYAPPHFSHDRVSSAATEQKSSILPAPSSFTEKSVLRINVAEPEQPKDVEQQQQPSQIVQEFLKGENYEQVPLQAAHSDIHPVYQPEEEKTSEKDVKINDQVPEETKNENQENDDANTQHHSDHQEE